MVTLDDLGLEIVKHPIKKVRLQFHKGKWYVEFRRQPKYFFDRWWWFDDSIYADYKDAYVRAQMLASEGASQEVKYKTIEFDVTDF
jgi:hypothetical protein